MEILRDIVSNASLTFTILSIRHKTYNEVYNMILDRLADPEERQLCIYARTLLSRHVDFTKRCDSFVEVLQGNNDVEKLMKLLKFAITTIMQLPETADLKTRIMHVISKCAMEAIRLDFDFMGNNFDQIIQNVLANSPVIDEPQPQVDEQQAEE